MYNCVDSLLAEIQEAASCRYLSDLHSFAVKFDEHTKVLISQIPEDRYTLDEWNEAAAYITRTACRFHSVRDVKEYINKNAEAQR